MFPLVGETFLDDVIEVSDDLTSDSTVKCVSKGWSLGCQVDDLDSPRCCITNVLVMVINKVTANPVVLVKRDIDEGAQVVIY